MSDTTNNETTIDIDKIKNGQNIDQNNDPNIEQIETPEFTKYVVEEIVQKEYERDIKDSLIWRKRWKKIAYVLYVVSKILSFFGAILAFFEPYFNVGYLAMISGCLNVIGLFLWHSGDNCISLSHERTRIANEYLRVLQIEQFPEDVTVKHPDKNRYIVKKDK